MEAQISDDERFEQEPERLVVGEKAVCTGPQRHHRRRLIDAMLLGGGVLLSEGGWCRTPTFGEAVSRTRITAHDF